MILANISPWQTSIIFWAVILGILFPVFAIIDILRKLAESNQKLLWVFIVLASNFFGSLIYFIVGRKQLRG